MTFGQRIRTVRIAQGLTQAATARQAGVHTQTVSRWESGRVTPKLWRAGDIARALGVPVAALFTDELVVAEVVVSAETVAAIRKGGRDVARAAAQRLAEQLEPAIWEAATRKPVDTRPGARAKPRRSRAEVLTARERLAALDEQRRRRPRTVE